MCVEKTDWEKVYEFHGHICPGLAIGFRATQLALQELGVSRSVDEELIAIVENDACGVDAVQVMAGCTFGKGNLFFKDYGKQVYTFARRAYGKAVRIAVKYKAFDNPELALLRQKKATGEATGEDKRALLKLQQEHVRNILNAGPEKFDIKTVDLELPSKAVIHKSYQCANCGESVMSTRAKEKDGQFLCIPCSEGATNEL